MKKRASRRIPKGIRSKKYDKLIAGRATKEAMIMAMSSILKALEGIKKERWDNRKNKPKMVREYPNIIPFNKLNVYSRKRLTGEYGYLLNIARIEKLV